MNHIIKCCYCFQLNHFGNKVVFFPFWPDGDNLACCIIILMHGPLEINVSQHVFNSLLQHDGILLYKTVSIIITGVFHFLTFITNNQPQAVFISSFWWVQEPVGWMFPPGKYQSRVWGGVFSPDRLFAQEDVGGCSHHIDITLRTQHENCAFLKEPVQKRDFFYKLAVILKDMQCQGFTVPQTEPLSTNHEPFGQGLIYGAMNRDQDVLLAFTHVKVVVFFPSTPPYTISIWATIILWIATHISRMISYFSSHLQRSTCLCFHNLS